MEQRFRVRLAELRQDAEVPLSLPQGLLPRLEAFLRPFVSSLQRTGRWQPHAAPGKHASNPGLLLQ